MNLFVSWFSKDCTFCCIKLFNVVQFWWSWNTLPMIVCIESARQSKSSFAASSIFLIFTYCVCIAFEQKFHAHVVVHFSRNLYATTRPSTILLYCWSNSMLHCVPVTFYSRKYTPIRLSSFERWHIEYIKLKHVCVKGTLDWFHSYLIL